MLVFEEGWDEHGRGLGKETSRARKRRGSQPETLESNETWTQKEDQMMGGKGAHCTDDRFSELSLGATMRQDLMTRCLFLR